MASGAEGRCGSPIHRWRTDVFSKNNKTIYVDMETDIIYLLCKKKASIDMWRIVMMAILCMQLVACSAATDSSGKTESSSTTRLTEVIATCNLTSSEYVELSDNGHSLMLDGRSDTVFNGLRNAQTICVLDELGVPSYIRMLMTRTSAIDGMQQEEFDSFKIHWTYHPDNGLDIIIHEK